MEGAPGRAVACQRIEQGERPREVLPESKPGGNAEETDIPFRRGGPEERTLPGLEEVLPVGPGQRYEAEQYQQKYTSVHREILRLSIDSGKILLGALHRTRQGHCSIPQILRRRHGTFRTHPPHEVRVDPRRVVAVLLHQCDLLL